MVIDQIRDEIRRFVSVEAPVAVACSGGVDSLVLADAMARFSRDGHVGSITLIYIDHGLQVRSREYGERVMVFAQERGLSAAVVRVDVNLRQASIEDAARIARYEALEKTADRRGIRWVALAHTATDQAETVLMRAIRGTGVRGLAAMAPCRDRFLRPLLRFSREDIQDYATRHGLQPILDPMNKDSRFFRVRVREDLMPRLRRENPRIDDALCRLAGAAGEHQVIIDWAAAQALSIAEIRPRVWSAEKLQGMPTAIGKLALARGVCLAGAGYLSAAHYQSLWDLVSGPDRGQTGVDLPGLRVVRNYDAVYVEERDSAARLVPIADVQVRGSHGPYLVRRWRAGDRMCPARLHGRSRKLSDLFIDAKIPRGQRSGAVVVYRQQDGVIEWVQGLGAAYDSDVEVILTEPSRVAK